MADHARPDFHTTERIIGFEPMTSAWKADMLPTTPYPQDCYQLYLGHLGGT